MAKLQQKLQKCILSLHNLLTIHLIRSSVYWFVPIFNLQHINESQQLKQKGKEKSIPSFVTETEKKETLHDDQSLSSTTQTNSNSSSVSNEGKRSREQSPKRKLSKERKSEKEQKENAVKRSISFGSLKSDDKDKKKK